MELIKEYLLLINDEFIKLNVPSINKINKVSEKEYHKVLMLKLVTLIYIDFSISDCCSIEGTFEKIKEIVKCLTSSMAALFGYLYLKDAKDNLQDYKNEKFVEFFSTINEIINKSSVISRKMMSELGSNIIICNDTTQSLLIQFSK